MPLVYQQNINVSTKLGVWHITEDEKFFLDKVSLQKEITHPHKRLQHLAGRYLLLELFPDFPIELIKIAFTNKPFLEDEAYHFSISHCGDYAAVIVSKKHRVGIDIEHFTDKVEKIKHKFLSVEELLLIDVNQQQLFLTISWSIKEALYKWYSLGEIDFKKHLIVQAIDIKNNKGTAQCIFSKNIEQHLVVNCLVFHKNCISWVCSL
jgi:phosphopantetheinyl transferase